MTAYLIAQTEIHDHETYDRYKAQVLPIIQKFGGVSSCVAALLKCWRAIGRRADWW